MSDRGLTATVALDITDLRALSDKLGPEAYGKAIENAVLDVAHYADARIKRHTPHVTGDARRWTSANLALATRGARSSAVVELEYPYANWLETGRDSRGRVMQKRVGGYRMVEQGHKEATEEAPGILRRAAEEIAATWGRR